MELIDQLRAEYDHEASHVWPHAGEQPDEATAASCSTIEPSGSP